MTDSEGCAGTGTALLRKREHMTRKKVGERIRTLRLGKKLSQFSLGGMVGVSDKAVSKWEREGVIPRQDVLVRLAQALDVELQDLIGEEEPDYPPESWDLITHRRELWNGAEKKLYQIYGDNIPLPVLNRFGEEMNRLSDSDAIVYFDIIRELQQIADREGKQFEGPGSLYGSFVSWLTGASPVNPLPPHYYCRKCRKTIFSTEAADGWDLPDRKCECGEVMAKDGHDIPFEAATCGASDPYTSMVFIVNSSILEEIQKKILKLAGPYYNIRRYAEEPEEEEDINITCVFLEAKDPNKETPDYVEDIKRVGNLYNWGTSTSYPVFRFFPLPDPKRTGRKAKPRTPTISDLMQEEVLIRALEYQNGSNESRDEIMNTNSVLKDPEAYRANLNFDRLVSLFCAMENAYMEENAEAMAKALHLPDPTAFPTSQEDLWKFIQKHSTKPAETQGIADRIVMKCRNGEYIHSLTPSDKVLFKQLNLPDWFPEYARRIIKLCHRGEMMLQGIRLVKNTWIKIQTVR